MHKAKFTADFLPGGTFEGWTDGSDWNGWATPMFEYDEALRLVVEYNTHPLGSTTKAWFDAVHDQFCFVTEREAEPECYSSVATNMQGREVRLYPIGTRVWIWELASHSR